MELLFFTFLLPYAIFGWWGVAASFLIGAVVYAAVEINVRRRTVVAVEEVTA